MTHGTIVAMAWGVVLGLAGTALPGALRAAESGASKRDTALCLAHGSIDTCSDAVRWSPSDPRVLTALGDAEARSGLWANALRHYSRAAEFAPEMKGLSGKIAAMQARLHPKKPVAVARHEVKPAAKMAAPKTAAAVSAPAPAHPLPVAVAMRDHSDARVEGAEKHYSNDAPVAETH